MIGRDQQFEQLLLECIDGGLSVLGNEPKEAVFQFLKTLCALPREAIPERIPDFAAGLKKALGGSSKVIERVILRKLFEKIGSSFRESPDLDFTEYVSDARRRYEMVAHRHEEPTDLIRSKKGQVSS